MKVRGRLITFEGPEGGGKTTQIRKTAHFLRQKDRAVLILREPGGTRTGEAVRQILLDRKQNRMARNAELLLYLAARAQIVEEKIIPALEKGVVVLLDRFEDSTVAYQGYGRGIPLKHIEQVSRALVRGTLKPDLTVVLDIDPVFGLKRGGRHDRMERQSLAFHRKVRKGFIAIAKKNPSRCLIIDAALDKSSVFQLIKERVQRVIR